MYTYRYVSLRKLEFLTSFAAAFFQPSSEVFRYEATMKIFFKFLIFLDDGLQNPKNTYSRNFSFRLIMYHYGTSYHTYPLVELTRANGRG